MYYKLKKECFIRCFKDFGYIKSYKGFFDKVFDDCGSIFLSCISRKPQHVDEIIKLIAEKFTDVEENDIKEDVISFLDELVNDGFLCKGNTLLEAIQYDNWNCYDEIANFPVIAKEEKLLKKDTQDYLSHYTSNKPLIFGCEVELTSKCNERCIHCYIPHENKINSIDPTVFYSLLDQLKEMNTLSLTLTGGEPMLHPLFKEFLREAKKRDFAVAVLSNLTLLDDEIIEILSEAPISSVQTSLYSLIPEHHDAITKLPGSYEKTMNAILRLIQNNIPIQISCPTMSINKDDYADVLDWAQKHNIRANTDYSIMAKYNHDTSNLEHRLSCEECGKIIKDLLNGDIHYQQAILSPDFLERMENLEENPEENFCGAGFSSCCVVSNGDIYPCAGWQSYICGNIKEKSLADIWFNSEKLNALRNIKRKDIKKCLNCKSKAFCSPCLTRFANESKTGNPLEVPEYFCSVAELNREIVLDWRKEVLEKTKRNS